MRHLQSINKYFWKYRYRLILGIVFIVTSNYFAILAPQITGYVFDLVKNHLGTKTITSHQYDWLVNLFIQSINTTGLTWKQSITICGVIILALALISGLFMFLMRQTIIVMSRLIEYDQKNEIFNHYLQLDTQFYKTYSTGDLMNRITEDVSRVRMYTGPAVMYLINLVARISLSVYYMFSKDWLLTLYVLSPLPVLAVTIYFVNSIINRRSEHIQELLSSLTTNAQESYSGIRVIKSFAQEKAMLNFFDKNANQYKERAIDLAKVESLYFPSMGLLIGLSTLLTIMIGGLYAIYGKPGVTVGTIAEFVLYINMLTFPVSAIGWTASIIQRALASQKRLNEFLHTRPKITQPLLPVTRTLEGNIDFTDVNFIYPNTGIHAIKNFSLKIRKGEKVAIIGKTGSGKSTIAQLLLRFYDASSGHITIDGMDIKSLDVQHLRKQIGYVPQDVFLFSDTIAENIAFGLSKKNVQKVKEAAAKACVEKEIEGFSHEYETMVGERGITLSGGQKQRTSIARALIKESQIVVFDDCLSAVDVKTEKEILESLYKYLSSKTAIIITHRIFSLFAFDKIIVLEDGVITEDGTHEELMTKKGYYAYLYFHQQLEANEKNHI